MDRMQALRDFAHGRPVSKSANLAEIMDIGMTALMLHNALHGRSTDDDGPDFDKSDMDGLFGAMEKALYGAEKAMHGGRRKKKKKDGVSKERSPESTQTLLQKIKDLVTTTEAPEDSAGTKQIQTHVSCVKAFDEEKGLITAVVLRPNVTDLHGDIYDAAEVEKACFNFNTRCGQSNIQHKQMANFPFTESFIVKADSELGEGTVLKGDWLATMHVDPVAHPVVWTAVKAGEFTGFSVGCDANVEAI